MHIVLLAESLLVARFSTKTPKKKSQMRMYQTGYNCDIFFYYKLSFSFFVLFFVQSVHCSTMTQLHRISSSEMGGACVFTLLQFYQYLILVLCIQTIIILGFALFFSVEIR